MKMLREPRFTRWAGHQEGKRVIVLGNGPSINDYTPDEIRAACDATVGVNEIGRYFQPTYLFVGDRPGLFRKRCGEEAWQVILTCIQSPKTQVFVTRPIESWLDIRKMPGIDQISEIQFAGKGSWGMPKDPNEYKVDFGRLWNVPTPNHIPHFPKFHTSTQAAVFLAVYMKAAWIGILGLDMTPGHFYQSSEEEHCLFKRLERQQVHWRETAKAAKEEFGIEIVNLSQRSLIETLPKVSKEDVLNSATKDR